ncbi:MAG: hypothetical protein E7052_11145, partial [Lentisphaerae bacterium]|nr:hypothetical protein [Lentisphaerota bacterium]
MMEYSIISDGGLQVVPQIAVVQQIIYLDFDGELTSYNGEILTVDNVEVQHSELSEERINNILKVLNEKYSDQNVIFVTEPPADTQYSTIYIGKTEAFNKYGNFAGLAETIDQNNANKTDKAFVMLDAANSNEEIINTISHESNHLLGTLNHGGEALEQYAEVHTVGSHSHKYYYNLVYMGALKESVHLFRNSIYSSSRPSSDGKDYIYKYFICGEDVTVYSGGGFYGSGFSVHHVGSNIAYIDKIDSQGVINNISGLQTSGRGNFTINGTASDVTI